MATDTSNSDSVKLNKADFISIDDYNNNDNALLSKFVRFTPSQQLDGYYRVRFLGKIQNSISHWEGYLPTSDYFLYQLRCVKNLGKEAAIFLLGGLDISIAGVIIFVIGFVMSILIRLPIGILLTLIQFFVVTFKSKNKI